jgi:hypothetical protein
MSVFTRSSASRPRTVVRSASPYESRSFVVECDGTTTAAYLRDAHDTTLGFCWVANHKTAPGSLDPARLDAGLPPLMPAAHTKHRAGGRKQLDPQALEVVWFEAGDGAILLEHGEPLCVIPGWADVDRGMPGYSRDTIGQTPFARSLDDASEGLVPRIDQARDHWKWQRAAESWPDFQQSALGHLLGRLGPGGNWWSEVGGKHLPRVGVSERPSTATRPYTILSTVGMSCQLMAPDRTLTDESGRRTATTDPVRVELALATTMPSKRAATVFRWLAPLPWRTATSFRAGGCLRWGRDDEDFPLGAQWQGVMLINSPAVMGGLPAPDLSGFTFGESRSRVRWLWVVPVTAEECDLADEQGSAALIRVLDREAGDRYVAQ